MPKGNFQKQMYDIDSWIETNFFSFMRWTHNECWQTSLMKDLHHKSEIYHEIIHVHTHTVLHLFCIDLILYLTLYKWNKISEKIYDYQFFWIHTMYIALRRIDGSIDGNNTHMILSKLLSQSSQDFIFWNFRAKLFYYM